MTAKRVLVVDDDERNRKLLATLVRAEGHEPTSAADAEEAMVLLGRDSFDLILLDIMMPGMDGLELTRWLKAQEFYKHIPIILITSLADRETRIAGLEAGAEEFLTKPVERTEFTARLRNLLRLKEYMDRVSRHNLNLRQEVELRTRELVETQFEIVRALGRAAEYRDNETGLHTLRMSKYAALIARALGFSEERAHLLRHAAPMHDIGKVGIPDSVLLKTERFDENDWAVMRTHSVIGARILTGKKSELVELARVVAQHHHERWDGTGYPDGLAGEDIPIEARIVAVTDVLDALLSRRSYKQPWAFEEAVAEIRRSSGSHFDPTVIEAFDSVIDEIEAVYRQYSD